MRRFAGIACAALLLAGCEAPEPVAVGTLEWDRVELITESSEPIVAVDAREGASVAAGALLLRLDDRRLAARLAEARATHDQAAAQLAELERGPRAERLVEARARLEGAQRQLAIRERELRRVAALEDRQAASQGLLDAAQRQRQAAATERELARAALEELENGTTVEELDQARQALARAAAAVRLLEVDLERLAVRAPVAARLDDLPFELGEQPSVGDVVAVLLAGDAPHARVYVPEAIRVHVTPGSRAEVRVDGLAEPLAGTVRKVSADPAFTPYFALTERDRGRLSYLAEIDLDTGGRPLPAGVPLEARFPDLPGGGRP